MGMSVPKTGITFVSEKLLIIILQRSFWSIMSWGTNLVKSDLAVGMGKLSVQC